MARAQTVESFSLELPAFEGFLTQPDPALALEKHLGESLPGCERLLRWAVVSTAPCRCEGAYLRR